MLEKAWLSGLSSLTCAYLRRIARTVRVQLISFAADRDRADSSFEGSIRAAMHAGELLLPFWNAHSLLLIASFLSSDRLSAFSGQFEAVADDSPGGELTQRIYARLGIAGRKLSVLSSESRLADVRTILETRPNLVLAADSHGPYRQIGTGTARLVRSYRNVLLLSAVSDSRVTIFRKLGMVVPTPGCNICVGLRPYIPSEPHGIEPLRLSVCDALTNLDDDLRRAIDRH